MPFLSKAELFNMHCDLQTTYYSLLQELWEAGWFDEQADERPPGLASIQRPLAPKASAPTDELPGGGPYRQSTGSGL